MTDQEQKPPPGTPPTVAFDFGNGMTIKVVCTGGLFHEPYSGNTVLVNLNNVVAPTELWATIFDTKLPLKITLFDEQLVHNDGRPLYTRARFFACSPEHATGGLSCFSRVSFLARTVEPSETHGRKQS